MKMKKIMTIWCLLVLILSLTACLAPEDPVIASLGEYDTSAFYSDGEFQDYTFYGKYEYSYAKIKHNDYFAKIESSDLPIIREHLDDFEGWVELIGEDAPSSELVVNYDFDPAIIDTEDYFYIESEKRTWSIGQTSLVNYDLYFFDAQTLCLYYFHNNI